MQTIARKKEDFLDEVNSKPPRRWKIQFGLATLAFLVLCTCGFFAGYRAGYDRGGDDKRRHTVYTATYSVADLVKPLQHKGLERDDFESLITLIKTTVEPTSWQSTGSIAPFRTNVSLVVCNTGDAHDQIKYLLSQLRQLRKAADEQVAKE